MRAIIIAVDATILFRARSEINAAGDIRWQRQQKERDQMNLLTLTLMEMQRMTQSTTQLSHLTK